MNVEFCSGSSTSSKAEDGSPRKSMPILSISSSRNSGLDVLALRIDWIIVIHNPDEAATAGLHLHPQVGRARIERVFQQFLDYRCRTLHHFTRGDLVSNLVGKNTNTAHLNEDSPHYNAVVCGLRRALKASVWKPISAMSSRWAPLRAYMS